jgi:hypothetical protein
VEKDSSELPKTRAEALELESKCYFTGNPCKNGHIFERWTSNGVCKQCMYEYKQTSVAKENMKKYYKKNFAAIQQYKKRWHEKNREKRKNYRQKHYSQNKKYYFYLAANRRAEKLQATLPGHEDAIKEIYRTCPEGWHVDHIIPLKGENVCGLHVPWNLQHLPADENIRKSNKLFY